MSISNDSRKCHGHYIKASRMFRTSSRCSIRLYPGKNGGCSQIIENSQIGMSRYLDTSTESTNGQNHGPVRKIQSFLSKGICTVILWQDCFGKGNWECLFVHREKVLFLSVYVDDIKLAGKKQNLDPMWKVLNKEVDLGEPTSFLDHENLGCTQRQCEISKYIMDHYRAMFESRISAGGEEEKELKNFHSLLGIFLNWECVFAKRARGLFLSVFVDDVKLAGKTENLEPTWKFLMEDVDLGEPTSFLDHKINDDVVASYRDMFESKFSAGAKEKTYQNFGETWCRNNIFVVQWHRKSRKDMCGKILRTCRINDSPSIQSIYSMHRWPPLQRRRIEICWRIVISMLSNCSEMFILGTFWKTWYSTVSEQTCTINHQMDQSLWQTIVSFYLLLSSYMWIQTVLSCGKHCQTMQTGTFSRLRFCRRSWGFKIYIKWSIVRFWKSCICSDKSDV